MTALNQATQIPPGIAKVEQMFLWSAFLLLALHRGLTYRETPDAGGTVPVISVGIANTADGKDRVIIRASIPLQADYATADIGKLWMAGDDIGTAQIPAAYTVDAA